MNTCWHNGVGIAGLGMSSLQADRISFSGGSAKLHKPKLPVKL